jgi:hypothetical protein
MILMATLIDIHAGKKGRRAAEVMLLPLVRAAREKIASDMDVDTQQSRGIIGGVTSAMGLISSCFGLGKTLSAEQVNESVVKKLTLRLTNYSGCTLLCSVESPSNPDNLGPVSTENQVLLPFESGNIEVYSVKGEVERSIRPIVIRLRSAVLGSSTHPEHTRSMKITFGPVANCTASEGQMFAIQEVVTTDDWGTGEETSVTNLHDLENIDPTKTYTSVVTSCDEESGITQLCSFNSPNSFGSSKVSGEDDDVYPSEGQVIALGYCLAPNDITTKGRGETQPLVDKMLESFPSDTNELEGDRSKTHTFILTNNMQDDLTNVDYLLADGGRKENITLAKGRSEYFSIIKKEDGSHAVFWEGLEIDKVTLNGDDHADDIEMRDNLIRFNYDGDHYHDVVNLDSGVANLSLTDSIDGHNNTLITSSYIAPNIAEMVLTTTAEGTGDPNMVYPSTDSGGWPTRELQFYNARSENQSVKIEFEGDNHSDNSLSPGSYYSWDVEGEYEEEWTVIHRETDQKINSLSLNGDGKSDDIMMPTNEGTPDDEINYNQDDNSNTKLVELDSGQAGMSVYDEVDGDSCRLYSEYVDDGVLRITIYDD